MKKKIENKHVPFFYWSLRTFSRCPIFSLYREISVEFVLFPPVITPHEYISILSLIL